MNVNIRLFSGLAVTVLLAAATAGAQPGTVPMTPHETVPLVSTEVTVPATYEGMFQGGRRLNLPEGWHVNVFHAGGLVKPRFLAWGPDSVLYVADVGAGKILAMHDSDPRDGVADNVVVAATDAFGHDLEFYNGDMYVAEQTRVLKLSDMDDDGVYETRSVFIDGIPGGGNHTTRTIVFDSLNQKVYISIGSSCNVCREDDRAIIAQYNIDGTGRRVYATGVRNAVGMTLHPRTGRLWATNNGHDNQGNDIPAEWIDLVREDGFYGWPFAYGYQVYNDFTRGADYQALLPITAEDSARVRSMVSPGALVQAHSALMAIEFPANNGAFPEKYGRGAFVVSRGSWNRQPPTGYKVMYLDFTDDQDTVADYVSDFLTGFLTDSSGTNWGRPVGLESDMRGNLYLTLDDGSESVLFITRDEPSGIGHEPTGSAGGTAFTEVYPNPTSGRVTVRFTLQFPARVTLALLDLNGNLVKTPVRDRAAGTGEGSISFETADLPAGTYLYRLSAGETLATGRVQVVR